LIENHLEIDRWIRDPQAEAGKLVVALSAMLPTSADRTWADRTQFEHYYQAVCPAGNPPLVEFLEKIDEQYADFAPVLKLSTPSRSLVDCYEEVAAAT
jgi:hypothetical protein